MEKKFHDLPPLKRFRLMHQQEQKPESTNSILSSSLPSKKRKESRDSAQTTLTTTTIPMPTSTYMLPTKKRIWAFPSFDLNIEYKPSSPKKKIQPKSDEIVDGDGDNDDDGILCCVCQSTDGDSTDPIVLCDGCDLMVHKTCYGIKVIPDGDWFCKQCSSNPKKKATLISCCLCPSSGGAMKPTNDGRWAHIVCALFVPEVFFEDPEGRDGIDCSKVAPRRWERRCYVCDSTNNGCVIECSELKCDLGFHVTCGLKEDLCIEYKEGKKKGVIVAGFCKDHTELWKKQQQTGKFRIVAREDPQ